MWNLHLGDFVSAPLSLQDFALCYGKDSKCLDDGAGSTTCFEIITAKRLAAGGWSAGWWNPYPVPTPLHWQEWELDKAEFRRLAAQIPGLSTLLAESVRSGVADVLALRRHGERLRVVAVECKTETGDPISPSQAVWISQFTRKFGRGSFAIARWRAVSPT